MALGNEVKLNNCKPERVEFSHRGGTEIQWFGPCCYQQIQVTSLVVVVLRIAASRLWTRNHPAAL
jgi:hypothetical protein